MASIAAEEYALSHILNAEGEKIQRVIEKATTVAELVKVNESVRLMVSDIAALEQILLEKLEHITCLCCDGGCSIPICGDDMLAPCDPIPGCGNSAQRRFFPEDSNFVAEYSLPLSELSGIDPDMPCPRRRRSQRY